MVTIMEIKNNNQIIKEKYIEVGERFKVAFNGYTHEGLAIAKIDGKDRKGCEYTNFPLFVFGALDKEFGFVEITKMNKTYAYAKMLRLFDENHSEYRNKPLCPHYTECGGCNLMHMTYKGQLVFKQKMVEDTLRKIGGFDNLKIEPIYGIPQNSMYYRNKVQVPVAGINNKTICGFYKRETHHIIPLEECYIQPLESTKLIKFVKNVCHEFGIKGVTYKEESGTLKHILVRKNHNETEYMVVLVVNKKDFISQEDLSLLTKKIVQKFPQVVSIVANINELMGNTILGDKCITLYGKDYITDTLCGLKFKIGAKSFYQVNHDMCEALYNNAIEVANLKPNDIIIDAYCGIGTIGLIAAGKVAKVYGVEIVDEAVKNANANAKLNKITNATFVCEKAENQIVKWMNEEIKPSVIFVDPPRKGLDSTLIDTIIKMKIEKVVYISCDPATLARDLKIFTESGYKINYVRPFDLFPQTNHIENVVSLSIVK